MDRISKSSNEPPLSSKNLIYLQNICLGLKDIPILGNKKNDSNQDK